MSSQFGEHVRIMEYFAGRKGTFLDVGAYDGITFSNTYELYLAGWSGVLIEPSPEAFCRLKRAYRDATDCELICAYLDPHCTGLFRLYESECYPVSTGFETHQYKFRRYPHTRITVGGINWDGLRFGREHFDFVNIDTEGSNYEVLASMPYRPDMLCVELDPEEKRFDFFRQVQAIGMHNYDVIGGNLLAWK